MLTSALSLQNYLSCYTSCPLCVDQVTSPDVTSEGVRQLVRQYLQAMVSSLTLCLHLILDAMQTESGSHSKITIRWYTKQVSTKYVFPPALPTPSMVCVCVSFYTWTWINHSIRQTDMQEGEDPGCQSDALLRPQATALRTRWCRMSELGTY